MGAYRYMVRAQQLLAGVVASVGHWLVGPGNALAWASLVVGHPSRFAHLRAQNWRAELFSRETSYKGGHLLGPHGVGWEFVDL